MNNLIGQKFGRLTVIKRSGTDKFGHILWLCRCECENEKEVISSNLIRGLTKSCGCIQKEKPNNTQHGLSKTTIYKKWKGMKNRCFNPKSLKYKDYGGRGITVCEEWRNNFMKYYEYVSKLPHFNEKGYSIDRINDNGNYEPGNVRWATAKEQANNTRRNKNNGN